ncbi:hypothetical protein LCGC14_0431940 [marine sediment metagenome]|uniref:Phospholipid/glycerol acyltransferase domain-containing protein n=1 Tax=marine sediment metagenome TaxID=412755 RepID=A0A0F9VXA4_9ZZZZ
MIDWLLFMFVRFCLWLRYRITVTGLPKIRRRGRRGILFLPNHPALIDPVMVMATLYPSFRPRALADRHQIDRFFIRSLARRAGALSITDLAKAGGTVEGARSAIDQCVHALRNGDNLILYPGGQVTRQRLEDLRGNSGVEMILREMPDVRIVLIRTHGLWGSGFSWASGKAPNVGRTLRSGIRALLASGIFFAPRRRVTMDVVEPDDFPRHESRAAINRYLEGFFNHDAPPNTHVPRSIWHRGGVQIRPEPPSLAKSGDLTQVSPATRTMIGEFLTELTGIEDISDTARLAHDLGMDSLMVMELVTWLQTEFGMMPGGVDSLQTVGDVMLVAGGQAVSAGTHRLKDVSRTWFTHLTDPRCPEGLNKLTIPQAFLLQASRHPRAALVADQVSGVRTCGDVMLAVRLLCGPIEALPGSNIGIMLPASVAASIMYLSVLFAGKTPAMINWTQGPKNLAHCIEAAGVEAILTSRVLVERLETQGVVFGDVRNLFVYVEDIRAQLGRWKKLSAVLTARLGWWHLRGRAARAPETAAILFTSGSENIPKAVPLTHRNMLTNIADVYRCFSLKRHDSLLGILPPFHSFGLTSSVLLPLCVSLRVVYSPNPTDAATLAATIDAYRPSMLAGTPTFLDGIVRASWGDQLRSLRLVVSGAEKCPPRVYEALQRRCPQTIVLEGYGATECSPIIAVNHEDAHQPYTIGPVLRSLMHAVVDIDITRRVPTGSEGMLLVRGPSVFSGYLDYDGPSPFVEFEGKKWYVTGDLVTEDAHGVLRFAGRLKRFVKLGGEMVSLPAIETILEDWFADQHDEGPVLAVTSPSPEDRAEIVLFTTKPIAREAANQVIREVGMSGLHNIRRVIRIDELPHLGTGKTDYRALQQRLDDEPDHEGS